MDKATGYCQWAGRRALRVLAYEKAATQFERALDMLEMAGNRDEARRCDLLLSLGDASLAAEARGMRA